jgi:hypothetical protein
MRIGCNPGGSGCASALRITSTHIDRSGAVRTIPQALSATLASALIAAPAFSGDFENRPLVSDAARMNHGATVSLNAQPLPPRSVAEPLAVTRNVDAGAAVSLNLQPLPPGGAGLTLKVRHPSGARVDPKEPSASRR